MAGSTTIGALNVKVTASAEQFNAIMEDMQRQVDGVGNSVKRNAGHLDELGEHAEHASFRTANAVSHAVTAFGENGLAGAMHAAGHVAGHTAIELGAAIVPVVAGMAALNLFAEGWKKAGEEMEKAAEKANGLKEALDKIAEAQQKGAQAIKDKNLKGSEKLNAAAEERDDERKALVERRKEIEKQQAEQEKIINQPKAGTGLFGMDDYFTRQQQADIANAKKNRDALNKDMDETNKKIAEKEKERDELRKRGRDAFKKEGDQEATDLRNAEKEAIEKAQKEEDEAERKAAEKRQHLLHAINAKSKEGQIQNIHDEAEARLKALDEFNFSDEERRKLEDQIRAGEESDIASLEGKGEKTRRDTLAGAQDFGSSAAFETVAKAGMDQQDKVAENTGNILAVARQQLKAQDDIAEGIARPGMNLIKF